MVMGRAYRGPLISGGRTCNNWSCGSVCVGRTIVPGFLDSRDGPLIHNIGPLTGESPGVTFGFPSKPSVQVYAYVMRGLCFAACVSRSL